MRVLNRALSEFWPSGTGAEYYRLLVLFVVLNAAADFTYPVVSRMGTVDPVLSPGEAIRGLQLGLLVLLAPRLALKHRDVLVSITFILLGVVFFGYHGGREEFTERFVWANKLLYLILFMALVRRVVNSAPDMAYRVGRLLVVSTLVFMVIPVLGSFFGLFGYRSYGDRLYRQGFKGFLFAINSASINVIVGMGLSLGFSKSVLVQFMFVAAAFLVGTKAAAAAGAAVAVLLAVRVTFGRTEVRHPLLRLIPVGVLGGLLAFSWPYLRAIQEQNWDFYLYRFQRTGSIMSVLTSGRWGYFEQFPAHVDSLLPAEWLLGTRRPTFNEIDFTALFTRFGLLGFFWYLLFFGEKTWQALKVWRRGPEEFAVALTLGMVLVHSMLGGHVLGNAVVAYHVATALVLCEHYAHRSSRRYWEADTVPALEPEEPALV